MDWSDSLVPALISADPLGRPLDPAPAPPLVGLDMAVSLPPGPTTRTDGPAASVSLDASSVSTGMGADGAAGADLLVRAPLVVNPAAAVVKVDGQGATWAPTPELTPWPAMGEVFVVPGERTETVDLLFQWTRKQTDYNNEVGLFEVDALGRVDGLAPGELGYAEAVLRSPSRQVLFSSRMAAGNWRQLSLSGGANLGFYVIQNGTSAEWLASNSLNQLSGRLALFTLDGANPDQFDHAKSTFLGDGIWQVNLEDRTHGGDQDFDDVVFQISRPGLMAPGRSGQRVDLTIAPVSQRSILKNEFGFYRVDGPDGAVDGIRPGEEGYWRAALGGTRHQVLMASGAKLGETTVSLPSGASLGWYLVNNTSSREALTRAGGERSVFFSYAAANADGLSHVHPRGDSQIWAWEETHRGGHRDFNDLVFRFAFGAPADPLPPPTLAIGDGQVSEGDSGTRDATFTVRLSRVATVPVSVSFRTADGSAVAPGDYTASAGRLTFAPGELEQAIRIPVVGDREREATEGFSVSLSDPTNANILDGLGMGTILDDDTPPPDATAPVADGESATVDEGGTSGNLALLEGDSDSPDEPSGSGLKVAEVNGVPLARIPLQSDGPHAGFHAVAGSAGTLVVKPDGTAFYIHNGSQTTSDSFTYRAVDGAGNLSNPADVRVTITPRPPRLSISNATINEGDDGVKNITFMVRLSRPSSQWVSVDYGTRAGSAVGGEDFEPSTGRITFEPGEVERTINIGVRGDLRDEPTETFGLNLFNPLNAAISQPDAIGTILDDDFNRPPVFTSTPIVQAEVGVPYAYILQAVDPNPKDQLTLSAISNPLNWPKIDIANGTAQLIQTPSILDVGQHAFAWQVSDQNGLTSTQHYTLAVSAVLKEGRSFSPSLERPLNIPSSPSLLRLKIEGISFDQSDVDSIKDAFEIDLLDVDGRSLVHTIGSDKTAFFNLTEGLPAAVAPGVTFDEQTGVLLLNLVGLQPETTARLVLRLINNDQDTASQLRITEISLDQAPLGTTATQATPLPPVQEALSARAMPSSLTNVTDSLEIQYARTTANSQKDLLQADFTLKNRGIYGINTQLLLAVKNISHAGVHVREADGISPDGFPYYDLSDQLVNNRLDPNQATAPARLVFHNPGQTQFTYDLVAYALVNQPPSILSQPGREVIRGQRYDYDIQAIDPDNDGLTYELLSSPPGMTIDAISGAIQWEAAERGTYNIDLQVSDGRGGEAQQSYSLSVVDPPANRPPVFHSDPVVDAYIKRTYSYNADAIDPDRDPLTYSLIAGPEGMTIHPESGQLEWLPPPALIVGDTVFGRIAIPGEKDGFVFGGSAGERIYIDPLQYSDIASNWHVDIYSPSGVQVVDDDLNGGILFSLSEDGNYRVDIQLTGDLTGSYAFSVVNAALAPFADFDAVINRTLAPGSEDDLYLFRAGAGERLYFDALSKDGNLGWALYDPGNKIIASDASFRDLELELPVSGDYLLALIGADSISKTVNYGFTIVTPESITQSIDFGATIDGALAEKGEQDTYEFSARAGEQLYFDSLGSAMFYGHLYDPTGRLLWRHDVRLDRSSPEGLILPVAGTYRLVIDGGLDHEWPQQSTGNYGFRLLARRDAEQVNLNREITGTLVRNGLEADSYRFSIEERTYFYIDGLMGTYDNAWLLYGPGGQLVVNRTFYQNHSSASYNDAELWLDPGDYWLLLQGNGAEAWNGGSNEYNLRLVTPSLITAPLALGASTRGRISEPGEQDGYTFTGSVGQQLFLDSFGGDQLWLRLFDPAGRELFNVDSRNDRAPHDGLTLTLAGTYKVVIDGERDVVGNYGFRLLDRAEATVVALDSDISGRFDNGGLEADSYRFSLAERSYIFVDGLTGSYDNAWLLYGPGGHYIASRYFYQNYQSDSYNDAEFWLDPGEYWLLLQGNGAEAWNGGSHDYKLRLVTPSFPTAPMSLGASTRGRISEPGEQDTYTFVGRVGQQLFLDSLGGDALRLRLLDPTGRELFNADSRADRAPHDGLTLTLAGTYRVVIDGERDSVGDYGFRLLDRANAAVVSLDSDISGRFDEGGLEADSYRFSLSERTSLYIDAVAGSYDNAWILYGPGGHYITHYQFYQNSSSASYNDAELWLEAGDYWLLLQGNGAEPWDGGSHDYKLRLVTPSSSTAPLTLGTSTRGRISEPGEQDTYTFDGRVGQQLYLDAFGGDGLRLRLLDPTGREVFNADSRADRAPHDGLTLTLPGTYRLVVDGERDLVGNYGFRLLNRADATVVALNTTIAGRFDEGGMEADSYRFRVTERTTIRIDAEFGNFDNAWILYSPGGSYLAHRQFYQNSTASHYNDAELWLDPGEYWLVLQGNGAESWTDGSNEYRLRLITLAVPPAFPPPIPTLPLQLGHIMAGTIAVIGEKHTYAFRGQIGQQLFLDGLGSPDVEVRFVDPSGRDLFTTRTLNDWGPNGGLVLSIEGTYQLVVSGFYPGSLGEYRFRLLDRTAGAEVSLDSEIVGQLAEGGLEVDSYRFSLSERSHLYIDAIFGSWDNAWLLYGPGGNYVTQRKFYQGYSSDAYNDAELWLDPGEYWLVVQGNGAEAWNGGSNDYKLRLVTPTITEAPLTLGSTIRGRINEAGEQDAYTFTGTAGQQLFFDSLGGDALRVRLFDPTGREIFNEDSRSDRAPNRGLTLTLSGTYRLVMDGERDAIGDYGFRLLDRADATAVVVNSTISGRFDEGGMEADSYRFSLGERNYIYFDAITGTYDNAWLLYDLGGNLIAQRRFYQGYPYDGYNDGEFWLNPGEYWLVLQGNGADEWNGGSNDYNLRLIKPSLSAAPMVLGSTIRGRISEAGEQDSYTFTGKAGQQLFFDSFGGDGLLFRLFDPTGREVFTANSRNNRGPNDGLILSLDGIYTIAMDGERDAIGDYAFRLLNRTDATLVSLDSDIVGRLDEGGMEADSYRFSLSEREYIYIDGINGDYDHAWLLYGPGGQVFADRTFYQGSGSNAYNDAEFWLDPGDYWLIVNGNGAEWWTAGSNDYKLRIVTPLLTTAPLTSSTPIRGRISEAGEQDSYSFTGTPGQQLFLDSFAGDGLRFRFFDPTGREIFNMDSRNDRGPNDGLILTMAGTYLLTLDGERDSIGDYGFRLFERSAATVVDLDREFAGSFDQGGMGAASYRFSLNQRSYLYIDGLLGNYDNAWTLYGPTGNYILSRYFDARRSADGYNDAELWLDPGEYWLVPQGFGAESWTNGSNDYKLRLITPELQTSTYELGSVVYGTIGEKGEQDTYTFIGMAGQRLALDGLLANTQILASLASPSGQVLFNRHGIQNNRQNIVLTESGLYRLTIDGAEEAMENYGFRLLEYGSAFSLSNSQAQSIQLNSPLAGSFDDVQQRQSDFYRFNSTAGTTIYIDVTSNPSGSGWTIYRPNGAQFSSGQLTVDGELSLTETGEYSLEIWGSGAGSRNYQLELISSQTLTQAYQIGQSVDGSISLKGEQDAYTFAGRAGQMLFLDQLIGNPQIKLKLYSPTGVLEWDGDTSADWAPRRLKETGTYRLIIDGLGEATGRYGFVLKDCEAAVPITLGTAITDSISEENGVRLYRINGEAGRQLTFNYRGRVLTPTVDPATGHFYALTDWTGTWSEAKAMAQAMGGQLATINQSQENVFLNKEFGSEKLWIGLSDAVKEGEWRWADGDGSPYRNWLNGQPDDWNRNEDYAVFNWNGDGRWNDISGTYGGIRGLVETDGTSPLRSQKWDGASWILYDPSGNTIAGPNSNLPDFSIALPSSGAYVLAIRDKDGLNLAYDFEVTDTTPAAVRTTGLNQVQSGTVSGGQEISHYFTANGGTLIYFDSQDNNSYWVRYRLVNPDGTIVFDDHDSRADRAPFRLTQTGQYTLQTYDWSYFRTSPYKYSLLEFSRSLASPAVTYLEQGSVTSGALRRGEVKIYTFEGLANQKVLLNKMQGYGMGVALYGPNGSQIYADNMTWEQSIDSGMLTLPQSGKYYLVVGNEAQSLVNYSFQMLTPNEAPEISYGISQQGTLTPGQASTFYSLNAEKGERLFFDIQSTNAPNADYRWVLYGPGNNILLNQDFRSDAEVTIPASGHYFLYLQGGRNAAAINYRFRIFQHDGPRRDILTPGAGEQVLNAQNALGLFNVKLGVRDGRGGSATQDYQVRLWPDPENGSPVIISRPEIRHAIDAQAYRYQLTSLDPDGDPLVYRLLDGPVGAFINGETGELLWFPEASIKPGDKGQFTVEVNDRRGGVDRQTFTVEVVSALGAIRGGVFDDLNGNGFRDTKLIRGDDPAVIFTLDVSGSTAAPFKGKGDFEGIETVVDAQVAAAKVLMEAILAQGAGDRVKVGLILFGSDALIQDLDPYTPGLQPYITVTTDLNQDGRRDIDQILATLKPGMFAGGTDIHTALDKIDILFDALPGNPNFIFMSDGYDSEFDKAKAKLTVDDLKSKGGNITAFAIGEAATTENLEAIDANAIQVIDFNELYDIFYGFDDRYAVEPWKEGVTVYLDLNNNQILDANEPSRTTKLDPSINSLEPIKNYFLFDNLLPGSYTVRVDVPSGSTLTAPPPEQTPIVDVITVAGEAYSHLFGLHKIAEPPNAEPVFLTQPPTNLALKAGQPVLYQALARDGDADPLSYGLAFAPEGMTIDAETGAVVWLPTQQQVKRAFDDLRLSNQAVVDRGRLDLVQRNPVFNVLVTVDDRKGGRAFQYLTLLLLNENRTPLFTSVLPKDPQAQVGKLLHYQATAQDPDGDALFYSLVAGPQGASIDSQTGLLSWIPSLTQQGGQRFQIKVVDGRGGEALQPVQITVIPAVSNRLPVITSIPRTRLQAGLAFDYEIVATDADGDPLTFSLPLAPEGMAIAGSRVSWTPSPSQLGHHPVKVQVMDRQGGLSIQTFTLMVSQRATNQVPVITSAPLLYTNLEREYRYQLLGADPDQDSLFWSLDTAPEGMLIDLKSGALRWQPNSSQVGEHAVTVKLIDVFGAQTQQSYKLLVSGTNLPPIILSTPPTQASLKQLYQYHVVAKDQEGDALAFKLINHPSGMQITASGLIEWQPRSIGRHDVEVQVTDTQNGKTLQTFSIVVSETAINLAPTITSQPQFRADIARRYAYAIQAVDPEGDRPLTFRLLEGPAGMVVDATTGLLTWDRPLLGVHRVVVSARDPQGLAATQGFILTGQANRLPELSATVSSTTAIAGATYRADIKAFDPDGDSLIFAVDTDSQSKGITIDPQGRLTWTPSRSHKGDHAVVLTLSDSVGGIVTRRFDITVQDDRVAPTVAIIPSKLSASQGEKLTFQVTASDNVGIADLKLFINNSPAVLDGYGQATILPSAPGMLAAKAVATDLAGNQTEASVTVNIVDPTDKEAPIISLQLASLAKQTISSLVPIVGSVNDTNLSFYALEVAPADGSAPFKEMFRGTTPVSNGVLGYFDPAKLANDSYWLRLIASDVNGRQNHVSAIVDVTGQLKLGNFKLSFTDLELPMHGIPISVTRTYDTLQSDHEGDMGYGWRLEFRNAQVRTSLPKDEFFAEYGIRSVGFKEGDSVYVTLPGGKRERFTFKLAAVNSLVNALLGNRRGLFKPSFFAENGSTSTLSVATQGVVLIRGGNGEAIPFSGGSTFSHYNPQDWGNTYTLTTKEGLVYSIDATTGKINLISDRNGNTLALSESGITSSNGETVSFERDAKGRIVNVLDPMGKRIRYQYDSNGDLVSVTDRLNNTTSYDYHQQRPHYLESIFDSLGNRGVRNEYDDQGRLGKVLNALGHAIQLTYDSDNSLYTTKNSLGYSTTYEYDLRGNVITELDANGGLTRRTYDEQNRLLSETNPEGETSSYTYDKDGNKLSETNPLGHVTRYRYNSAGDLLSTTDPLGHVVETAYDSNGNPLSITGLGSGSIQLTYAAGGLLESLSTGGAITRYAYDHRGNIIKEINALGHETTYTYDANGNRVTEARSLTTADGVKSVVTITQYNSNGDVIKVTDPLGHVTQTVYDANGNKIKEIDALGRITQYIYSDTGQLLETIYPDATPQTDHDNPRIKKEYDSANQLIADIDELDRRTEYQYDPLGRLTFTIFPDATINDSSDNPRKETRYDRAGRVIAEINERGHQTRYDYDDAGRRSKMILADGTPDDQDNPYFIFSYDAVGRQTSLTNPLGHITRTLYDSLGRSIGQIFADQSKIATTYDAAGRVQSRTDQMGLITRYEYNAIGQLTAVIDALNQRTSYAYNELGQLISQEDALGRVTRYSYDLLGRKIATQLPLGQRSVTAYDSVGNVKSITDFNGITIQLAYDERNRLLRRILPDKTQISYTYTLTGKRASEATSLGTTTYNYDQRDRLLSRRDPDDVAISYTYDGLGNRTSVTIPSGTTYYGFDQQNRLQTVTDPANGKTVYTYDLAGNLVTTYLPNATVEKRVYDVLNRLVYLQSTNQNATINSFQYSLDKSGNRIGVVEQDGRKVSYDYDSLYRLLKEDVYDAVRRTTSFTYDPVGNRLTRADSSAGLTNYEYDNNDRLLREDNHTSTIHYTYDNNGNMLSKRSPALTVSYVWDLENRLVGVDSNGDGTEDVRNAYDGDGIRVRQTLEGSETRYLVDKNLDYAQVLLHYTANKSIQESYTFGRGYISRLTSQGASYFHVDGLGSIRAISDADGNIVKKYDFSAYGELLTEDVSTPYSYLFAGEKRDAYLGLDYLRSRYYQNSTGRFISMDSFIGLRILPHSLNKYIYAHSNPVNHVDPSGNLILIGLDLGGLYTSTLRAQQSASTTLALNYSAGKALEMAVVNTLRNFAYRHGGAQVFTQVRFVGPGGLRFADAVVKLGNKFVAVEVKTQIPTGGASLVRFGGQLRTYAGGAPTSTVLQGQAVETIVITEQSAAAIEASFLAIESQVGAGTITGILQGSSHLTTILRGVLYGL